MDVATQRRLVGALAAHLAQTENRGDAAEIVETHISWVILAGTHAYKLKKPLDLGFLDFSSLDKRRHACDEEVRLNRRTAPDLYLDVVTVGGSVDAPRLGATPALEYAVRMRRFARAEGLDFLLARAALGGAEITAMAAMIARFHAQAARAADGRHGTPARALADALANFSQMPDLGFDADTRERLRRLREWTCAEQARLAPLMERRMRAGRVRECHGDLHLANMVRHDGRIVAFDCIEFNPEMRWIDVMSDLAFALMDLRHRGRADFARLLQDAYLQHSGDWEGVALLPFYLVYRALVRAKVAALRAAGAAGDAPARRAALGDFGTHVLLADAIARPGRAHLIITAGLSGAGKTHVSGALVAARDWVRLRADVERKRLAGLEPHERSHSAVAQGLYSTAAGERVYAHLGALAGDLLAAGNVVIVDATCMKRAQREAFRRLAARCDVPFTILHCSAERAELERRILARNARGDDASEADSAVLAAQIAGAEAIAADEADDVLEIDTCRPLCVPALAAAIEAHAAAHFAARGEAHG
jgi:aminoglycoside phosphotransferase family enzyme/predicted kinase